MTTDAPVQPTRLSWATAVLAVSVFIGFVAVRGAFIAAHRIIGWTVACIAVAVFVEPIVAALGRFIPRVLAVIVTFVLLGGLVFGLAVGAVSDLDNEVARLQRVTPDAIEELEARDDGVGRLASEIRLRERAETFLDALDDRVGSTSGALAENATTAPVYFVCAILTIFLLVYGPSIARGAARQIDDPTMRRVLFRVMEDAAHRARRTVSALLTQGLVIGGATMLFAELVDLPAPIVLGLVAGVAAMLPDFGILLGSLATAALTAAFESVALAVVVLVVALAVQLFEAFYIRRRVREFGVDIGPAIIWIVAVLGYTLYGPGMAFYGVVYAVFVLAVVDQVPAARIALEAGVSMPVADVDDVAAAPPPRAPE